MDTFSGINEAAFGQPFAPAAPEPPRPLLDMGHIADMFTASRQAAEYGDNINARSLALHDATQNRIAMIRQLTGENLENPIARAPLTGAELDDPQAAPLDRAALQAYADRHADYRPGQIPSGMAQGEIDQLRVEAFMGQLADLQQRRPDAAGVIGADRPLDFDARGLARGAELKLALTGQNANLGEALIGGIGGGAAAMVRDPFQMGSLAFGGGEVKAVSLFGKIAEAAVRQGLVNAGIQAFMEPAVQAWRAEVGQDSGLAPAAKDVGLAALFGGGLGAVLKGAGVAIKAARTASERRTLQRALESAPRGDVEAAQTLADHLPPDVAQELHTALQGARLDGEALPLHPEGLRRADADRLYGEAIAHEQDPRAPLPESAPPVAPGVSDTAARRALDADREDRLRQTAPDVFGRIDDLESQIGAAQGRLGDVLAGDRADLPGRIADLQSQMNGLTKKQRRGGDGVALREELDRLLGSGSGLGLGVTDAERAARVALNDLQQQRAALGPGVAAVDRRVARDPLRDAAILRADPKLVESALASADPGLARLGRLASLSDSAFAMVRNGDVDPAHAAHVPGVAPDPLDHGSYLDELKFWQPKTEDEARRVLTEAAQARALPAAQARIAEAAAPLDRLPEVRAPRETPAEGLKQAQALRDELLPRAGPQPAEGAGAPVPDMIDRIGVPTRDGFKTAAIEDIMHEAPREHVMAQLIEDCPL